MTTTMTTTMTTETTTETTTEALSRQTLVYRAEREVTAGLEQEYAELSRLVARGRDPQTGRPFTSVEALLSTFIGGQHPSDGEVLITLVDGEEREFTPDNARARALLAPSFVSRYAANNDRVDTGELRVPTGERIRYLSIPVAVDGDPRSGHLVVAIDLSARLTEVNDVVRVLVAVSAGALLLAGLAGWLVAGRCWHPYAWYG